VVPDAAAVELAQGQVVLDAGITEPAAAPAGLMSPSEGVAQAAATSIDCCSGVLQHMYAVQNSPSGGCGVGGYAHSHL
jgi:hypothetical protein